MILLNMGLEIKVTRISGTNMERPKGQDQRQLWGAENQQKISGISTMQLQRTQFCQQLEWAWKQVFPRTHTHKQVQMMETLMSEHSQDADTLFMLHILPLELWIAKWVLFGTGASKGWTPSSIPITALWSFPHHHHHHHQALTVIYTEQKARNSHWAPLSVASPSPQSKVY